MEAQRCKVKPDICPLCGSDNVTIHEYHSKCGHCEYSWYPTSLVPTANELWRIFKLCRRDARRVPYTLEKDRLVDQAYRWWLIRVRPETVVPYLPIHK
jgi:ribosomal protein S27AE